MKGSILKIVFISIFSLVSSFVSYGQIVDLDSDNPYKKVFVDTDDFDASYLTVLEESWDKVKDDTIGLSMLNDLAYYWHTRNLNTSLAFAKKGLILSAYKNNPLWEGRFQITLGSILLRMEKLDSAFIVLKDAKNKVKEEDLAFLNTQLGYVFERRGELDKAADYALESLRLGEKLHDKKAIALAYSDLSNIFWKQSKFEKGLEYGLKSISIFEKRGIKDLDYDFTLYVVGNNYLELGKYEEALAYYNRSIEMGEQYGFYNNLSDVYISLVDLNVYLKQFEAAESAGAYAVKYAELLENNFMIMRSWLSIGKLQNLEGKSKEAIQSLQKSIKVATQDFGDEYYLSQAYEALGVAFAATQAYEEAYQAFIKYDKLKDSIFTAEADQRISHLQTEFDVALKESTIKLQETELAQQSTRQTIIIVIASFLLLFVLVLYKSYQNNKKKNALLERQNKEKEFLLKEIHHRVKNNLEIVSSLLALQSAQLTDANVVNVMQESQNRVQSMSMIHQKLYQGTNLSTIEMKGYFNNLGTHVLDSFGMEEQVNLTCEMQALELDVDTAIPLGLIVNELLTNALKYAFPDNRKGEVKLALEQKDKELLCLEVSDNGIGQSMNEKIGETGFGMRLVSLLCQQLQGKMNRMMKDGTSISFEFKIEHHNS
ncbi:histidine kinase dimerization/phosphoacceptor domain -containing protein [Fulvivirgaceae bacterium BMA10]|uniref:histidine kinase n=1 Tax=Splendidivirga corallicola TaxID=3051826 RepID=A0ABT8KY27_9BACT|nr:histidine kinase dimerization/phosphoacceptor domain -containing protein [Fulvivirgaceae bacterium BMA10]